MIKYLNVPGLYDSGENHWQTNWEQLYPNNFLRVQQQDWENPSKEAWVGTLHSTIQILNSPCILVAHSLGCITAIHWAATHYSPFINGLLLVAPADVENTSKAVLKDFAPVPLIKPDIPAIVVASMNDPFCSMERSAKLAAYWGARFVSIGNRGHINAESGLGDWKEGIALLHELETRAEHSRYRHAC